MKSQRRNRVSGFQMVVTFHKLFMLPIFLKLQTGTFKLQRNSAEANTHLLGVVVRHDQLLGFWFLNNVVTVHISEVHGSFPVL